MALENYSSEETTDSEKLADRLDEAMIEHRKAAENIAYDYVDAIEAVHGWFNQPAHRSILLEKDFTHLGTGSYGNYYTQDFIKATKEDVRRKQPGPTPKQLGTEKVIRPVTHCSYGS